jgi:ABC-type multidrug transport system permease subunit
LLDIPLSGLDVYEAFQTVSVLRQVAVDLNTAVLISIDQPSSEVLFALDDVTFISRGSVVFSGNPSDIVSYFLQMGYDCPPSYSPSDYLLFLLEVVPPEEHDRLVASWQWHRGNELVDHDLHHASTLQSLMDGIRKNLDEEDGVIVDERMISTPPPRSPVGSSPMSPAIVSRAVNPIEPLSDDDVDPSPSSPSSMGTPVSRIGFGLEPTSGGTGVTNQVRSIEGGKPSSIRSQKPFVRNNRLNVFAQFYFLYIREFKFFTRSIDSFIIRTALFAILSALVALMLFDIGTDAIGALTNMVDSSVLETTLNDYYGAISIMILLGLFGNVERVSVAIPAIRALFLAEHDMARLYSLFPFLLAQIFIELPVTLIMSIVQISISYWIIGFVGNFFIWVLIVFLGSVATSSVGWLICSLTYSPLTALQLVPVIILPQILFSGLLIDIRLIPPWLAWMEYLCYLKYCINVAVINETDSLQPYQQIQDLASQNYISLDKTGTYVSIICIFIVGARLLAAIALHYNRKIISWNL